MMLRDNGRTERPTGSSRAIAEDARPKTVTYDFASLMDGAKEVKCSEFGTAIIKSMEAF